MARKYLIPSSLEEILDPDSTAFVVWDMQVGMAGRAFNLPTVEANTHRLISAADAADVAVVWSRHSGLPLEYTSNVRLADLMERQGAKSPSELHRHMEPDTDEWQWLPDFHPSDGHLVLDKSTPSFFVGTPFELAVRSRGIRSLVLAGVATERGIEMTARHAIALGFFVVVAEDGVGSFTQEGHNLGLQYLRSAMPVVSTEEIVRSWSRTGD